MNMNMNGGRMFARNNMDDKFEEADEIFEKVRGVVFINFDELIEGNCKV